MDGLGNRGGLVVVVLPGVQRFIAKSRSTSIASAVSETYSALAARVVRALSQVGGNLALPAGKGSVDASPGSVGMPNRVVALHPPGTGAAARRASGAVCDAWQDRVRNALELARSRPLPATPRFPSVQWACVPADPAGYRAQRQQAQRLFVARRIRNFPAVAEEDWKRRALCSLVPHWPAEPAAPRGIQQHEQRTSRSAIGWVKRRLRYLSEDGGKAGVDPTRDRAAIDEGKRLIPPLKPVGDDQVSAYLRQHRRPASRRCRDIAFRLWSQGATCNADVGWIVNANISLLRARRAGSYSDGLT